MNGWGLHALLIGGLLMAPPAAALELELAKPLDGGADVTFRVDGPDTLDEPFEHAGLQLELTTEHYKIYADLDSISYDERGGYVSYDLYVEPKPGVDGA